MNEILYEKEQLPILRKSFGCGMTLIQFTINMPGPNKKAYPSSELIWLGIGSLILYLIQHNVKIEDMMFKNSSLGMIALFKINEEAIYIKQICINFEQNYLLSKYWDIDVFNKAGEKISRKMLQMPPRKCFICDKLAKECTFLQSHTTKELIEKMIMDFNEYFKIC